MRITILSMILVLILMGALAVAAFVRVCIAGALGLGVWLDQSNVGWAVEAGTLRLVLIAAVAVAAAALITLRRLRIR